MERRHTDGKALWQEKIRPHLLEADAEDGLDFILDRLEEAPNDPANWKDFQHFYGAGPYADAPIQIGNDEYHITLRNQVGLPAGLTKDGRGLRALDATGLGFIEIGTNPPAAQYGNERPRFFAEYREEENLFILINRFGFNCEEGFDGPIRRVQKIWRECGEQEIRASLIWSFGPNKATMERYEETLDLRLIANDIVKASACAMPAIRTGDAVSFNVTSPNTRGLRTLLERFPELLDLVMVGIRMVADTYRRPTPPCLIKLSPDMPAAQMRHVARATAPHKEVIALEGFNTTIDERIRAEYGITEIGGISGELLEHLAHDKLVLLNAILEEEGLDLDLIGVGGILRPYQAIDRLAIGKSVKAVQILTALFDDGLTLIPEIQEALG